jgi:hypothetical protein
MASGSNTHTRSALASTLSRCLAVCEETLDEQHGAERSPATARFARAAMLAAAALETAIANDDGGRDDDRRVSLVIARTLCRDAAEAARRSAPDGSLLRFAETLDRAAMRCDQALRSSG